MDRDAALIVCKLADELLSKAAELLDVVNGFPQDERGRFHAALGTVISEVDLEILETVYKQYPDLRPLEMEEIKECGNRSERNPDEGR